VTAFGPKLKFRIGKPLTVICRLSGPSGFVRELQAAIDPNFEFCSLLRQDAAILGYPSVTYRPVDLRAIAGIQGTPGVVDSRGLEMGTKIKLKEVSVGRLKARDVETVVLYNEFPILYPVSAMLGRSFLANFKLTVDYKAGSFTLS
jgi:hypothetical protein